MSHNHWTPESLKICICTRRLCKMLLNFQAAQASTNFQLSCPDPSENASDGEFPRRRGQYGGIQSCISPETVFEQCLICLLVPMHSMTVWLECHLAAAPISAAVRGLPLTAALRAWPQDSLPHYDAWHQVCTIKCLCVWSLSIIQSLKEMHACSSLSISWRVSLLDIPQGDRALNAARRVIPDNACKWPPWQIGWPGPRRPWWPGLDSSQNAKWCPIVQEKGNCPCCLKLLLRFLSEAISWEAPSIGFSI